MVTATEHSRSIAADALSRIERDLSTVRGYHAPARGHLSIGRLMQSMYRHGDGAPVGFRSSEDEAADYLLTISQGFGPHSRDQWMALTRPMLRRDGDRFRLHYDPAIAVPLRAVTPEAAALGQAALWAAYDAIRCPTLLVRGADSDLLSRATADQMTQRGPKPRLHEFAGVGHAPTLVAPGQVDVVREFLLAP